MADELAKLTPPQLAGFYRRLADSVDRNKGNLTISLAALLMRHWLDNRDPASTFVFDAPDHLKNDARVRETLQFHRRVFLTEEKGRLSGNVFRWLGILPRYQGRPGYPKWDGRMPLTLEYQSLVELPVISIQLAGSDAERDILYALHGFQLKSRVTVTGALAQGSKQLRISFQKFEAEISDRYHWDYTEHLKVPNPDFGSKSKDAVTPGERMVQVYHSNAKRLEDAGLAAPYDEKTNPFVVLDAELIKPGNIDPARSL